MQVIPVIDVRHGVAVRAAGGRRAAYEPLVTPLARSNDPVAVAKGYRSLFPFSTIYVADLDGIEGRGESIGLATRLCDALPKVAFWIDAGRTRPAADATYTTVIGSEVLSNADVNAIDRNAVLSFDMRGRTFLGPESLLSTPSLWPRRVVLMDLARVGMDAGPDLARIRHAVNDAPQAQVFVAGGIRDLADLRAARAAGAHGALIASALHAGKIKADDLDEIIGL